MADKKKLKAETKDIYSKIPDVTVFSNAPYDGNDAVEAYKYSVGAIKSALKEKRNRNIGIIGDFGSGKSSAIAIFKKANSLSKRKERRKIAQISLADFCQDSVVKDKNLQFSIVQQLFHSVYRARIPTSKFVKRGIKIRSVVFFISLLLGVLFLSLGLANSFNVLKSGGKYPFYFISAICFFIALFFFFLVYSFRSIRAKVKDVEVEINDIDPNDIFDHFLEEIIYFFFMTNVDLVIFEDIDRTPNCNELFTKLYTLNVAINNFPKFRNGKRSVVFLHAVKETMFPDGEEKSKYFDVLIPIRPVYTSSSAMDVFKNKLNSLNYDIKIFKDNFLETLQYSVQYIRQLNNLLTAFNIIKKQLMIDDKDTEKNTSLMAILLYKSLFPTDYIFALKDKGVLRYLFSPGKREFQDYLNNKDYCTSSLANKERMKLNPNDNEKVINYKDAFNSKYDSEKEVFDKIKHFYEDVEDFLNEESFFLISPIPTDGLPENIAIYLKEVINGKVHNNFDEHFEDANLILSNPSFIKYIRNPSACRIELLEKMLTDEKYKTILNEFCNSFTSNDEFRNLFVLRCIDKFNESNDKRYLKFFESISLTYNYLNETIINRIGKQKIIEFLNVNKLLNNENFDFQNEKNIIVDVLLGETDLSLLSTFSDEIFINKISTLNIKFPYLFYGVDNFKSLKNKLDYIILNNMFVVSKENVMFIYEYFTNKKFNNDFLSAFTNNLNVLNYIVNSFLDAGRDFSVITNNYSNENDSFINQLIKDNPFDLSRIPNFFETCKPIFIDSNTAVDGKYLLKLYNISKIKGTLDTFGWLRETNPSFKMVTYFSNNFNLLEKGNPTTREGFNFLNAILDSTTIVNESVEYLFNNCLENYKIKIENVAIESVAFSYMLENEEIEINQDLLNKIADNDKLLKALFSNEKNRLKIIKNLSDYKFSKSQLVNLLNCEFNTENVTTILNNFNEIVIEDIQQFKQFIDRANQMALIKSIFVFYLNYTDFGDDKIQKLLNNRFSELSSEEKLNYIKGQLQKLKLIYLEFDKNENNSHFYNACRCRGIDRRTTRKKYHIFIKK